MTTPMVRVRGRFRRYGSGSASASRGGHETGSASGDVPAYSGPLIRPISVRRSIIDLSPRTGPNLNGPDMDITEPHSPVPGATAHSVGSGACRHRLGVAGPTYPGLAQRRQNAGIKTPTRVEFGRVSGFPGSSGQLPRVGTQLERDPYDEDGRSAEKN